MQARFFATPTAVREWMAVIAPGCSEEDALTDLLDWSSDATREDRPAPNGAAVYRARRPLRCYFLVDESEQPLPAITKVLKPHASWRPPPNGKPIRGPGQPRTVTAPGEAHSEGQPEVRARVPRAVKEWVDSQGPGFLGRLVLAAYRREKS